MPADLHSVREPTHDGPMLHATLICTDEDCAETVEVWGELDAMALVLCDGCDCVMQIIAVSESDDMVRCSPDHRSGSAPPSAPLVHLPVRVAQRRAA